MSQKWKENNTKKWKNLENAAWNIKYPRKVSKINNQKDNLIHKKQCAKAVHKYSTQKVMQQKDDTNGKINRCHVICHKNTRQKCTKYTL